MQIQNIKSFYLISSKSCHVLKLSTYAHFNQKNLSVFVILIKGFFMVEKKILLAADRLPREIVSLNQNKAAMIDGNASKHNITWKGKLNMSNLVIRDFCNSLLYVTIFNIYTWSVRIPSNLSVNTLKLIYDRVLQWNILNSNIQRISKTISREIRYNPYLVLVKTLMENVFKANIRQGEIL